MSLEGMAEHYQSKTRLFALSKPPQTSAERRIVNYNDIPEKAFISDLSLHNFPTIQGNL